MTELVDGPPRRFHAVLVEFALSADVDFATVIGPLLFAIRNKTLAPPPLSVTSFSGSDAVLVIAAGAAVHSCARDSCAGYPEPCGGCCTCLGGCGHSGPVAE